MTTTLEKMAKVIDPDAWEDSMWPLTRAGIEGMHERRQFSIVKAVAVLQIFVSDDSLPFETRNILRTCLPPERKENDQSSNL